MAITPWNSSLASALRYIEIGSAIGSAGTGYHPTSAMAANIWRAEHRWIAARLSAVGITVGTAADTKAAFSDIEALRVSCKVGEANEIQTDGEVSPHTRWLDQQFKEKMSALLHDAGIAEALGATVSDTKGPHPSSLYVDFPNATRNTGDDYYADPVADWKIGDDL